MSEKSKPANMHDPRTLALILGVAGYIAGIYLVLTQNPTTIMGMAATAMGLLLLSVSAPCPGFLVRILMHGRYPTSKEYIVFVSFGLYMSTAALLMIILSYGGWRTFSLLASLIILATIPLIEKAGKGW